MYNLVFDNFIDMLNVLLFCVYEFFFFLPVNRTHLQTKKKEYIENCEVQWLAILAPWPLSPGNMTSPLRGGWGSLWLSRGAEGTALKGA